MEERKITDFTGKKIYISGISGTGMGPLALFAKDAGFKVVGSDLKRGPIADELDKAKIKYEIGEQDGEFLKKQGKIDWFIYTSALPEDHKELKYAKEKGFKVSKRDEFIAYLTKELDLDMVAVAGTHGKTTTTSMIIWLAEQFGAPASYMVGTTLGFAKSGKYKKNSYFFIYEADEYDENFLAYHPWISAITTVSYDHPDTYPTRQDYYDAFEQFERQSEISVFSRRKEIKCDEYDLSRDTQVMIMMDGDEKRIRLAGKARRRDASMADYIIEKMMQASGIPMGTYTREIIKKLNKFPGVGRRFERISDGIYSDYAHHPEEIKATIETAKEEAKLRKKKGVVAIYEPHQNTRQHKVFHEYRGAFLGVEKLFWLPTYLTREDPDLEVITPKEFVDSLSNSKVGEVAEMNDSLASKIREYRDKGYLILLMTAGPADEWLREIVSKF